MSSISKSRITFRVVSPTLLQWIVKTKRETAQWNVNSRSSIYRGIHRASRIFNWKPSQLAFTRRGPLNGWMDEIYRSSNASELRILLSGFASADSDLYWRYSSVLRFPCITSPRTRSGKPRVKLRNNIVPTRGNKYRIPMERWINSTQCRGCPRYYSARVTGIRYYP